jgi:hypothetical protein
MNAHGNNAPDSTSIDRKYRAVFTYSTQPRPDAMSGEDFTFELTKSGMAKPPGCGGAGWISSRNSLLVVDGRVAFLLLRNNSRAAAPPTSHQTVLSSGSLNFLDFFSGIVGAGASTGASLILCFW